MFRYSWRIIIHLSIFCFTCHRSLDNFCTSINGATLRQKYKKKNRKHFQESDPFCKQNNQCFNGTIEIRYLRNTLDYCKMGFAFFPCSKKWTLFVNKSSFFNNPRDCRYVITISIMIYMITATALINNRYISKYINTYLTVMLFFHFVKLIVLQISLSKIQTKHKIFVLSEVTSGLKHHV